MKHAYYYIQDIPNQIITTTLRTRSKTVTTTSSKTKQVFLNCPPQLSNIGPQRQASRSKLEYLISFVFNDVCHNCYFNRLLVNSFFSLLYPGKKNCWAPQNCAHLLQLIWRIYATPNQSRMPNVDASNSSCIDDQCSAQCGQKNYEVEFNFLNCFFFNILLGYIG